MSDMIWINTWITVDCMHIILWIIRNPLLIVTVLLSYYRYSNFERSSHSPERPHSEPAVTSYHILDLDSRHTMSAGVPPIPHHLTAVPRVPSPAHITPRSRASPVSEHESMDTDSHPLNLRCITLHWNLKFKYIKHKAVIFQKRKTHRKLALLKLLWQFLYKNLSLLIFKMTLQWNNLAWTATR